MYCKLNQALYQGAWTSDPNIAIEHGFFSRNLYPSHMDDITFFLNNKEALKSGSNVKLSECMFSANVNCIHTRSPNEGPFEASAGENGLNLEAESGFQSQVLIRPR